MKFWEAMRALEEGKKVRRIDWIPKAILFKHNNVLVWNMGKTEYSYASLSENMSFEWELYEEPQKLLTFAEVLQGMKEGKRFTRKRFEEPMIYQKSRYGDFPSCIYGGELHTLSFQDFEATDWIEVKE